MSNFKEVCPETFESAELILQNVSILGELLFHLSKEARNGENSINSLNNLVCQASKDLSSINQCVDSVGVIAKQLVQLSLQMVSTDDPNYRLLESEANKLMNVLGDIKDKEEERSDMMWKGRANIKCVDDKYPERCSKESLLDISNVVNLPTVPEDAFTNFQRPNRTSSSCSLKNLRKIKLCLQKAASLDTEEESDTNQQICSQRKVFEVIHANSQTTDDLMPAGIKGLHK